MNKPLTPNMEMYLKTIYEIVDEGSEPLAGFGNGVSLGHEANCTSRCTSSQDEAVSTWRETQPITSVPWQRLEAP